MDGKELARIDSLIHKYQHGTLTASEELELDQWRTASRENEVRFELRLKENFFIEGLSILREADESMHTDLDRVEYPKRVVPLKPKWKIYSTAAAVIFLVAAGLIYYLFRTTTPYQPASIAGKPAIGLVPGGNKAVLTLDNGQQIVLDSAENGVLAKQGGSIVQKVAGGQLSYVIGDKLAGVTGYNSIATPAGGQYKVVLPDGSRVWLNDLSSLRFPTAFTGAERIIDLTGEAYLEVAKDPLHPFKVRTGNTTITVLGTHFNVNAYPDEKFIATTLLEGLVTVSAGGKTVTITPGQEARAGKQFSIVKADTSAVAAWKDGFFEFSDADITTVMRQLARWYGIDVRFEGKAPSQLVSGRISRNNMANDVLSFLETSGYHFKIDGKTILVLP